MCTVVVRCDSVYVYGLVMRCDYTHHAQCIRVGLQRRRFGVNNATALSKAMLDGSNPLKSSYLKLIMELHNY